MPETQTCPKCGRTWEYTPLKSRCPRCNVETITDCPVQKPLSTTFAPALRGHAEIEREFSDLRNKLRGDKCKDCGVLLTNLREKATGLCDECLYRRIATGEKGGTR